MNVDRLMNKWYEEIMATKSSHISNVKTLNSCIKDESKKLPKVECFRAYVRDNGYMLVEVNAWNKMSSANKEFINKNYVYGGLV